ncbi:MAG: SDR family oxidoreductase [Clostridiales bacterium]|nr:SDR family oxidoreductase [Clostridiales bacterium]
MDLGLKGKVAVVTGASEGIGLAIAREFLASGAKVAICARRAERIKQAARELGAPGEVWFASADATREEEVYRFAADAFAHFGRIDAWVNNVGATVIKDGWEFTGADVDLIVGLCFKSALFGAQAAFRHMRESGGAIVNISSLAARCPTAGRSTLYGPMKAAVNSLTQTLAGEYAAWNVRVNCVMPGFTATPAVRDAIPEAELRHNAENTLLGRVADPSEIARPAVFLASDAASYMTAEVIEVSGGRARTLNPGYSAQLRERGR